MFSKGDIAEFSLTVNLPKVESKENIIEQFITNHPLSTLKFEAMKEIVALRRLVDELPTLVMTADGISLNLSKDKLTIEITTRERAIREEKEVDLFSSEYLKKISADANFVIAGIIGLLKVVSLKTEGFLRLSKEIESEIKFDGCLHKIF
jgi:hypothetical protein